MRAAIYARVSSQAQRDKHTIESQLRTLPEFVTARGWSLVGKYVDDGHTAAFGKLAARVGLANVLRDAALHLFDVLVVVDVDRLTRSEDLTERGAILGGLQRAGVKVAIAATGQILDFSDSMGDLYGSLQAFFAAEWARKHRTRIIEGKLTAIARGKKPAGPTPYGYRYARETGVWSVCEDEADIVREIFRRCAAGETGDAIARDLTARGVARPQGGEWIRERVYGVLRQPAYRGEWIANKARGLTVPTPRLIDDDLWLAARDRDASKARRVRGLRRTKSVYLAEGVAVCTCCGGRIGIASASSGRRGVGSKPRYVCARRRRPDERGRCTLRYWLADEVDGRIWAVLQRLVQTPGRLERAAAAAIAAAGADGETWKKDLASAERRLTTLARGEAAILARFRRGAISERAMDLELTAAAAEREMAERQVESARRAQFAAGQRQVRAAALQTMVAELRSRAAATTPAQRYELVRALAGLRIELGPDRIELLVKLRAGVGQEGRAGYFESNETSMEFRLVA